MTISIFPITSGFVVEIGDVDLSQPLTLAEVDVIKQAFWDYAIFIFPEQDLIRILEANDSPRVKILIRKLQAILKGARAPAFATDPDLSYADTAELQLLLERLKATDPSHRN